MKKPVLVIMAAGMGSRYGGLKQIDPVDEQGHIIMDFSIYDARRAGFEEVIFIIKQENEQLFREAIGDRISKSMKVRYAFQDIRDLPEGFEVPQERKKPWGTGHAVLSARDLIDGPFAVINADDYYGVEAFRLIYDFLIRQEEERERGGSFSLEEYVMAGYLLKNTLTENGSVARGVCTTDEAGNLTSIVERTKIIRKEEDAAYLDEDGKTWIPVSGESVVSMNMWGFPYSFLLRLSVLSAFQSAWERQGLPWNSAWCRSGLNRIPPATWNRLSDTWLERPLPEQGQDLLCLRLNLLRQKTQRMWCRCSFRRTDRCLFR